MQSVILSSPLAMLLYGLGLGLCLFDRHHKLPGVVFPLASAVVVLLATAYAILIGAGLWECATALLVFLLLNMGVAE